MDDELLGPLSYVRSMSGINKTQIATLEALGFGIDIVDQVYRRLAQMLRSASPPTELAFADAWAIIDWMHRLKTLAAGCPGLTQRDEAVRDFLDTAALVESLRNIFQHPVGELIATVESRRSVWGHLAWQIEREEGHLVVQLSPFSRWEGEYGKPDRAEDPPRAAVDRVSLFSPDGDVEIGLTGQWEGAVRFGLRLDAALHASGRPDSGEIMKVRTWLPAPPDAVYPDLASRVTSDKRGSSS